MKTSIYVKIVLFKIVFPAKLITSNVMNAKQAILCIKNKEFIFAKKLVLKVFYLLKNHFESYLIRI